MLLHFLLAASLQVAGESEYPSHEVLRLDGTVEAPVIDGVLDDAAWERCTPITDLRQVIPVAGAQPSEATEILLAVDEDHLYVGLRCFDSDPSRIRATVPWQPKHDDLGEIITHALQWERKLEQIRDQEG